MIVFPAQMIQTVGKRKQKGIENIYLPSFYIIQPEFTANQPGRYNYNRPERRLMCFGITLYQKKKWKEKKKVLEHCPGRSYNCVWQNCQRIDDIQHSGCNYIPVQKPFWFVIRIQIIFAVFRIPFIKIGRIFSGRQTRTYYPAAKVATTRVNRITPWFSNSKEQEESRQDNYKIAGCRVQNIALRWLKISKPNRVHSCYFCSVF